MHNENDSRTLKFDLKQSLALLGEPPVLKTEQPKHYDAMFHQFLHCFEPEDFFELLQVREMVNAGWEIKSYTRHKTVAVERWHRQSLEFQAQRRRLQAARREELERDQAEAMSRTPQDIGLAMRLEEKALDVVKDVDEPLTRTPTELEHNRALEKGMATQESFEKLIASATLRFHKALELFEHYRLVLAPQVRERAKKIIEDAEYQVVDNDLPEIEEAPLIVPSSDK